MAALARQREPISTGIRCHEMTKLNEGQVNLNTRYLEDVRGKGDRYDSLYVNDVLLPLIRDYLLERCAEMLRRDPLYAAMSEEQRARYPLLNSFHYSQPGQPESFRLSDAAVRRIMRELGELAGVPNLHEHALRHTFAYELIRAGVPIELCADLMRHENINTTRRYVTRPESERIEAVNLLTRRTASKE